jgi:hypothetical protein
MTLSERLNKQATYNFRVSLFQRYIAGENIAVNESYIYLNGMNVEERRCTAEDLDVVMQVHGDWKMKHSAEVRP